MVDVAQMVDDVLAFPGHLEDALWRVESAGLDRVFAEVDGIEHLIVAGMGGSAIGADLARAALGDRLTKPMITVRGYHLPPWVTPSSVVLCASYSGNTEETLACYEAAGALGAMRVVATTGGRLAEAAREDGVPVIPLPAGLQPRAAVAYMMVPALEVATLSGVAQGVRTEIDAAAAGLERLAQEWGPDADSDSLAKRVAQRINGTCVCVYGADPTGAAATRWKTQLNENAKLPAFAAELPEADHNEIVGLAGCGRALQLHRGLPGGRRPASARAPAHRADSRADRAAGGRNAAPGERGLESGGAAAVAGSAGRPRLRLPRGPARHRPHAGRADRAVEVGAGAAQR